MRLAACILTNQTRVPLIQQFEFPLEETSQCETCVDCSDMHLSLLHGDYHSFLSLSSRGCVGLSVCLPQGEMKGFILHKKLFVVFIPLKNISGPHLRARHCHYQPDLMDESKQSLHLGRESVYLPGLHVALCSGPIV